MKSLILVFLSTFSYLATTAQFVARMEAKEPIPGVCNIKNIIVPFPNFKGQKAEVMPISKKDLEVRLNNELNSLEIIQPTAIKE